MKRLKQMAAGLTAIAVLALSVPVCPVTAWGEEAQQPESPAAGQETPDLVIRTAEEFLEFARSCTSESFSHGKRVSLEADLDLGGAAFSPVPVFCGTFAGNGHTIRGISIRRSGTSLGLFRYLGQEALVENLAVEGELKPEGSRKRPEALWAPTGEPSGDAPSPAPGKPWSIWGELPGSMRKQGSSKTV